MKRRKTLVVGLIGVVCGVLLAIGGMSIKNMTTKSSDTRSIKATATAKYYYEDGDYTSMEFTDETGNMWIVEDYVCNLGTDCLLTFDTQGTEEIEDDEIISISISITVEKE